MSRIINTQRDPNLYGLPKVRATVVTFEARLNLIKPAGAHDLKLTVFRGDTGKKTTVLGTHNSISDCTLGLTYEFKCTHGGQAKDGETAQWRLKKMKLIPSDQPRDPSCG